MPRSAAITPAGTHRLSAPTPLALRHGGRKHGTDSADFEVIHCADIVLSVPTESEPSVLSADEDDWEILTSPDETTIDEYASSKAVDSSVVVVAA
ncbi:hypothetical protein JCM8097_007607 [Rhodosporidiobolus ruineniae]